MDLDKIRWDAAGLVTVVAQSVRGGEVRMVAHANREALEFAKRIGADAYLTKPFEIEDLYRIARAGPSRMR